MNRVVKQCFYTALLCLLLIFMLCACAKTGSNDQGNNSTPDKVTSNVNSGNTNSNENEIDWNEDATSDTNNVVNPSLDKTNSNTDSNETGNESEALAGDTSTTSGVEVAPPIDDEGYGPIVKP